MERKNWTKHNVIKSWSVNSVYFLLNWILFLCHYNFRNFTKLNIYTRKGFFSLEPSYHISVATVTWLLTAVSILLFTFFSNLNSVKLFMLLWIFSILRGIKKTFLNGECKKLVFSTTKKCKETNGGLKFDFKTYLLVYLTSIIFQHYLFFTCSNLLNYSLEC